MTISCRFRHSHSVWVEVLCGGLLILFPSGVRDGLAQSDHQALELIQKMAETYRTLESYQFEGIMKRELKAEGYQQTREIPVLKAAILPDKLRVERGWPKTRMVMVSNGQESWLYLAQLNQYSRSAPMDVKRFLEQGPSDESASFSTLYRSFVTQYATLPDTVKRARVLREETLDLAEESRPCVVVEVELGGEEGSKKEEILPRVLWIEKNRNLVLKETSGSRSESPDFEGMLESKQTLTLRLARINVPLPDSLFAFQPPANAKEISLAGVRRPGRRSLEGQAAREFTLRDAKGESFTLASLRGKVVLLNFWATWCGPCRTEMPFLDRLQKDYKDQGLVVLGITDEEPELAQRFLVTNHISFPSLFDRQQEVAALYQVIAIPTILVINREGKIVFQSIGVSNEGPLKTALKEAGLVAP